MTSSLIPLPANSADLCEFIPGQFYFTSCPTEPRASPHANFFTIDRVLVYQPFYLDTGPLNFGQVVRFCELVQSLRARRLRDDVPLVLYSSMEPAARANAAFLMGAFMLLVEGQSAQEAFRPLNNVQPPLATFRDAGYGEACFFLSVYDCLTGLDKARAEGLLNLDNFDLDEYAHYERVENGDINWLGGKFVAFASPIEANSPGARAYAQNRYFDANRYRQAFGSLLGHLRQHDVKHIVRLNDQLYDKRRFTELGMGHTEMPFPDGSNPRPEVVARFLKLVDSVEGAVGVHCKAGLGRTGSLIGCWYMRTHGFTATEVIAWMRVLRPGTVVGPQQLWLGTMEAEMHELGVRMSGARKRSLSSMASYTTTSSETASVRSDTAASVPRTFEIPVQPRKGMADKLQEEELHRDAMNRYKAKVSSKNSRRGVLGRP